MTTGLRARLDAVTLDPALVMAPPLELWPAIVRRGRLPDDVEAQLIRPIETYRVSNDADGAQPERSTDDGMADQGGLA